MSRLVGILAVVTGCHGRGAHHRRTKPGSHALDFSQLNLVHYRCVTLFPPPIPTIPRRQQHRRHNVIPEPYARLPLLIKDLLTLP